MSGTGVYLYGIARRLTAEDLGEVTGVAGTPVRLVEEGGLTGVVSTVPLSEFGEEGLRRNLEDLAWVESVARAHNAVVSQCFPHGPLAPVSLATVCYDDESVRARIRQWREQVEGLLERVSGRSEVGVKVFGTPPLPSPDETGAGAAEAATREADAASGSGAGAAYLRRRQAETDRSRAASARAAEVAADLHARIARHSVASRRHPVQDHRLSGRSDMLLNGAYLVDDSALEEFERTVRELAGGWPGLQVELTGPWPPYSFVSLEQP